jgi:uncharacterized membrane protein YeaQ/YmgE (transglycosylase-associated protein family)
LFTPKTGTADSEHLDASATTLNGSERGVYPLQRVYAMGIILWIVVGLIAGWGAGQVMKGGGYGVVADIVLGILGGVLGGWLFGLLGISSGGGLIGSVIVAFIGAVILIWITRLIKKA